MDNLLFKNAYLSYSRVDKQNIRVRDEICLKCAVSTPTFYNWTKGITKIPKLCEPIIAQVLKMEIEELFPEKELITTN